ncbi:MAG: glycoside hydrolase family 2 protein [Bacteroidetes bacterium]|nr:glycoside hydrolase family 2 protein [Bacteroidota bacterium]
MKKSILYLVVLCLVVIKTNAQSNNRNVENFNKDWKFYYADTTDLKNDYKEENYNDAQWRTLNLPHDWSVELPFAKNNPAAPEGGALPGGIGWYRKTFVVPVTSKNKQIRIEFDGVYRCSEVWVNGHRLGFRPNGYISFQYNLTPYIKFGEKNSIVVKVDNSKQMNSRWYSGSGIYRNVRLVTTNNIAVAHWGSFVTTPKTSSAQATVNIQLSLNNTTKNNANVITVNTIYDVQGNVVAKKTINNILLKENETTKVEDELIVKQPVLWSIEKPVLYKVVSQIIQNGKIVDSYTTSIGIRSFYFDANKGFFLNNKPLKILGVCNHHDLGCLGAAINYRAIERQLEILKSFGCNAIRTSHNPPAPELLELCDKMGFIVMDEAFDMWKIAKTEYDYHLYWDEWHKKDLEDQILRDRNHPSVFMWSIGNEIPEQEHSSGTSIATELVGIVKNLDTTRAIVDANDRPFPSKNYILKSNMFDLVGYNYHHSLYKSFPDSFPNKKFIASETTSGLETRGEYFFPSDSIRVWPPQHKKGEDRNSGMNADFTVSAYDNTRAPWSSTHEQTWKIIKKYPYLSGMFIWTGFDYLGEPTPYTWPAKSSYFGIVDLAGFPKDVYYMYQSEWTNKDVLHILPHWNWKQGDSVDVWAYYNHADEVELFVNGKSAGIRKKQGDDLHVMWRVLYEAGNIKAVSRKNGQVVLSKQINTAGEAAQIELTADRKIINANGEDMSFITVRILDKDGNLVPKADNLINFTINGEAFIAGVDNGNPVSHEPFKASYRKAFNGLALAIIQAKEKKGTVKITATSNGLKPASVNLILK